VSDRVQDPGGALAAAAAEMIRHLAWLESAGVREVPPPSAPAPIEHTAATAHARPSEGTADRAIRDASPRFPVLDRAPGGSPRPAEAPAAQRTPPAGRTPAAASATGAYALEDKGCGSEALLAVRRDLGECARCKLSQKRTKVVFGVGNPRAELVFVGEGPGEDEDLSGEPFVGKAGQLLTKMIEAMGFRREDVYIANVVKCRPPGNRNPEPDEIEACEPFLKAQLAAIQPKVIVALGKFAAHTLLRETTPISKLRGRWSEYAGVRLMPTFHPAYLLRSPEEKKKAWEDLQLVMKELGKPVPGR
jgi:uracil-DNA glycosylase